MVTSCRQPERLQLGMPFTSTTSGSQLHIPSTNYVKQVLPPAQFYCAIPFTISVMFTSSLSNHLADCCSCFFHFSDMDFLSHQQCTCTVQQSWQLAHPTSVMISAMNSALCIKLPKMVSHTRNMDHLPSATTLRDTTLASLLLDGLQSPKHSGEVRLHLFTTYTA